MLQRISIQNYAIIDELEIDFSKHLNILTGETGAGKSIIMGALGLILGERADSSVLVNKEKKSVVEGVFDAEDRKEIKKFLEENEFDVSDELVIRREIAVNGKSRAFINDTPVNLSQLQELSSMLVDLHQQFDTLELGDSGFQRDVLDAMAAHRSLIESYRNSYQKWQISKKEWEALLEQKRQFEKEADYNRFQFKELDEAGFKPGELESTETEIKLLANAESVKAALTQANYVLMESDEPVVQQLKSLSNQLSGFVSYHKDLSSILERIQAAQVELKDLAGEIEHISNAINYDPAKIENLNERLSLGYKLQKKHGVKTTNELIEIRNKLEVKLGEELIIEEKINEKDRETKIYFEEVRQLAEKISTGRKKQIRPLEEKVNKLLIQVGMPNARLKVDLRQVSHGPDGADEVEFLFNANVSQSEAEKDAIFQPVSKVASGGELSRLMLCIKSLVASSLDMPTLIFDEIDTGISGEAARQVGIILRDLASKRQVICITHQPQIAGKAHAHFFVYKDILNDRIKTNIRKLSTEERITAIAKMLSGEKPTAAAIENAREMVMN